MDKDAKQELEAELEELFDPHMGKTPKGIECHIHQITSRVVCGDQYVGKWWCVAYSLGNNISAVRYLHSDGTWQRNTGYFDTNDAIKTVLANCEEPDFSITWEDRYAHDVIQQDMEAMFDDDREDDLSEMLDGEF